MPHQGPEQLLALPPTSGEREHLRERAADLVSTLKPLLLFHVGHSAFETDVPYIGNSVRFSPFAVHGREIPSYYAGTTPEVAIAEAVMRRGPIAGVPAVLPYESVAGKIVVSTATVTELKVLDLTSASARHLPVAIECLTSCTERGYAGSQAWAQAFVEELGIAAIKWNSRQSPEGQCYVFFDDPAGSLRLRKARPELTHSDLVTFVLRNRKAWNILPVGGGFGRP